VRGKEIGDKNAESPSDYLAEPMAQAFSGGHLGLMRRGALDQAPRAMGMNL
jgi:hypothetical protein